MTNDLISREALKKALHNFFDGKVIDEPTYILRDVFCYIDNAPTVEPFELVTKNGITYPKALDNMTFSHTLSTEERQNIIQAYMLGLYERPRGKWVELRSYDYKCSLCGN
jgi:hypothetical protein